MQQLPPPHLRPLGSRLAQYVLHKYAPFQVAFGWPQVAERNGCARKRSHFVLQSVLLRFLPTRRGPAFWFTFLFIQLKM